MRVLAWSFDIFFCLVPTLTGVCVGVISGLRSTKMFEKVHEVPGRSASVKSCIQAMSRVI